MKKIDLLIPDVIQFILGIITLVFVVAFDIEAPSAITTAFIAYISLRLVIISLESRDSKQDKKRSKEAP